MENNKIVLFPNEKTKPSQPDYTGTIQFGDITRRVALWSTVSKGGKPYLSGSHSEFVQDTIHQRPNTPDDSIEPNDEYSDDLPF